MQAVTPRPMTSEAPSSNDFVEHLRTVHFTLLVASLGLFVISMSLSPYKIRIANQQLAQIEELRTVWKGDDWLMEAENSAARNSLCEPSKPIQFLLDLQGKQVLITVAEHSKEIDPVVGLVNQMGFSFDSGLSYQLQIYPMNLSVASFRKMWDTSFTLACPSMPDPSAAFVLRGTTWEKVPVKVVPMDKSSTPTEAYVRALGTTETMKFDGLPKDEYVYVGSLGTSKENPKIAAVPLVSPGDFRLVAIPFRMERDRHFSLRDPIARALPAYHWRHADFKDAFYELDQATSGFQDLPFPVVEEILRAEEKNTRETFELFGVRFPSDAPARWGVVVLLGIQVYFWLHLAEYRRRGFSNTDIAWIGCYPSFWPKVLFSITTVLGPAALVTFLLFFHAESPFTNRAISDLTLAFSLLLGGLSWREYSRSAVRESRTAKTAAV